MSRNLEDLDPENMSADDIAYFDQRPWLKDEIRMQSGGKLDFDTIVADQRKALEENEESEVDEQAQTEPTVVTTTTTTPTPTSNPVTPAEEEEEELEDAEDYSDFDHKALKGEIDKRNEDYTDEYKISKAGSADELRARLVEDDKENEEEAE